MTKVARVGLLALVIGLVGCTSGTVLLTGTKRPPIRPDAVTIYLERPSQPFEVVALVTAESVQGWTWQAAMDHAVLELKRQAAKIGANGVLLEGAGREVTGAGGVMTTSGYGTFGTGTYMAAYSESQVVKGRAIYVAP